MSDFCHNTNHNTGDVPIAIREHSWETCAHHYAESRGAYSFSFRDDPMIGTWLVLESLPAYRLELGDHIGGMTITGIAKAEHNGKPAFRLTLDIVNAGAGEANVEGRMIVPDESLMLYVERLLDALTIDVAANVAYFAAEAPSR